MKLGLKTVKSHAVELDFVSAKLNQHTYSDTYPCEFIEQLRLTVGRTV